MKKNKQLALIASALFLFGSVSSALAATNDYANYWTFDEGGGRSTNDLVGGQNGVLTGSSTGFGWASGKVGTALAMDGAMGIGVALPNAFLTGSQGSISLWFDMAELSGHNIIFSGKSTTDNSVYAAFAVDSDGRPTFQFRDATNANDRKAQGARLLNKNEWYNVVLTANALTYHMFVNGEEVTIAGDNIGRWFPDITNQAFMYRIGTLDATPMNGSFNGILDDVRIYGRALSFDEVTALYAEGNKAVPTIPASVAPKITFSISQDHISYGGSVELNWSTTNITSCTASGGWNGDMGVSGSKSFTLLASDTTYALHCVGKYGSSDASVNVYVAAKNATSTGTTGASGGISVTSVLPPVTTPSVKSLNLIRNLSVGSRGDDVKSFQLLLISKGYLAAELSTGYFGMLTRAAAIKLQAELALPQTGFVGPMTRAKLSAQ